MVVLTKTFLLSLSACIKNLSPFLSFFFVSKIKIKIKSAPLYSAVPVSHKAAHHPHTLAGWTGPAPPQFLSVSREPPSARVFGGRRRLCSPFLPSFPRTCWLFTPASGSCCPLNILHPEAELVFYQHRTTTTFYLYKIAFCLCVDGEAGPICLSICACCPCCLSMCRPMIWNTHHFLTPFFLILVLNKP